MWTCVVEQLYILHKIQYFVMYLYFEIKLYVSCVISVLITVTFQLKLIWYLILILSSCFSCVFQNVKLKIVKHVLIAIFAQNVRRACIHTVDDVMSAVLQTRAP